MVELVKEVKGMRGEARCWGEEKKTRISKGISRRCTLRCYRTNKVPMGKRIFREKKKTLRREYNIKYKGNLPQGTVSDPRLFAEWLFAKNRRSKKTIIREKDPFERE